MPSALVFPGQGSQRAGMGADLLERSNAARGVFEQADAASGLPIGRLCATGSDDELRPTEVAQPAILATELALLAALGEVLGFGSYRPEVADSLGASWVAGHSLGEYAACVASGALAPDDALRLAARRGRLMSEARSGTMAAVLGLDVAKVGELCARVGGEVCVANDNAPGQVVVSGSDEAVAELSALAKEAGARRVLPLNVSGAFHSPLMEPAAAAFAADVDAVSLLDPLVPIVANVSASPLRNAVAVRRELRDQIARPVRWRETLLWLADAGAESLIECGPGDVLAGLAKRTVPTVPVSSISGLDDVIAAVA